MQFRIINLQSAISSTDLDVVYLIIDNWNDYSFVTSFRVQMVDKAGVIHELPAVKIGFIGQTADIRTHQRLGDSFEQISDIFFSLGVDVEYYRYLHSNFSEEWRQEFLGSLRDVVADQNILEMVEDEEVFQTSLLRYLSITNIRDQFVSVLNGDVLLTDFDFGFQLPTSDSFAGFDLSFKVTANSIPSTNMHALIGRNGVGKTTLLKSMVKAIVDVQGTEASFYTSNIFGNQSIDDDYFSSLVLVAFSVFDPFDSPLGTTSERHSYIGLINHTQNGQASIKEQHQILDEFANGLVSCFEDNLRRNRWIQAIKTLQSDDNFADMELLSLESLRGDDLRNRALNLISRMSSGHSIVILTMTLLVLKVEEKSLVLFDEPEGHLHPPLLSALMRSLSQLLHTRNAVAIIATHSPVVLQEIPGSCVWKVFRTRLASEKKRPDSETFGENVGTLTREVFGLEVDRSGFHTVLKDLVSQGGSYNDIVEKLGGSLGNEARGILRAMVVNRDENTDQ